MDGRTPRYSRDVEHVFSSLQPLKISVREWGYYEDKDGNRISTQDDHSSSLDTTSLSSPPFYFSTSTSLLLLLPSSRLRSSPHAKPRCVAPSASKAFLSRFKSIPSSSRRVGRMGWLVVETLRNVVLPELVSGAARGGMLDRQRWRAKPGRKAPLERGAVLFRLFLKSDRWRRCSPGLCESSTVRFLSPRLLHLNPCANPTF